MFEFDSAKHTSHIFRSVLEMFRRCNASICVQDVVHFFIFSVARSASNSRVTCEASTFITVAKPVIIASVTSLFSVMVAGSSTVSVKVTSTTLGGAVVVVSESSPSVFELVTGKHSNAVPEVHDKKIKTSPAPTRNRFSCNRYSCSLGKEHSFLT